MTVDPTLRALLSAPALDFDELRFEWGDVVLAAIGWGEWQELVGALAHGPARGADGPARGANGPARGADGPARGADGDEPDPAELRAAVVAFRRARGLLAGEDYLRWLADRGLSTADVVAHLELKLGREPARARPDHAARGRTDQSRAEAEPGARLRAEAILGGWLERWAGRLADCAAAARGLGATGGAQPEASAGVAGGAQPEASAGAVSALVERAVAHPESGLTEADARARAPRVAALLAAEGAFADAVTTGERLARCLAAHRLEWQRLVWEEATFAGEGAAREAALFVREDGMALAEVAGLAHVAARVREAYCGDVPELSSLLVAAAPGELAGPVQGESGWRLLRVLERTAPALEDVAVAERARALIVEEALDRHRAGRVRRHDRY